MRGKAGVRPSERIVFEGFVYRRENAFKPMLVVGDELAYCVSAEMYKKLRDDNEALEQLFMEVGRRALLQQHQVQNDRGHVIDYLRLVHPEVECEADRLYELGDALKQECKEFLREQMGENPKTKQRIDDVFAAPRKPRGRAKNYFSLPVKRP